MVKKYLKGYLVFKRMKKRILYRKKQKAALKI